MLSIHADAPTAPENQHFIVTFLLAQQTYALPIEAVVEIVEISSVIPTPGVNGSVTGTIDLGGALIPAVDLRAHLGLPEVGLKPQTPVLLVEVGERTVGLIVDRVTAVLDLTTERRVKPDEMYPGAVIHTSRGNALLLDLIHLFSPNQISTLARTTELLPTANDPLGLGASAMWSHVND